MVVETAVVTASVCGGAVVVVRRVLVVVAGVRAGGARGGVRVPPGRGRGVPRGGRGPEAAASHLPDHVGDGRGAEDAPNPRGHGGALWW